MTKDLNISKDNKWEKDFKRMYPLEYVIDGMVQSGIDPKGAEIMAEAHRNEIIFFLRESFSSELKNLFKEIEKKIIGEDEEVVHIN